MTTHTLNKIRWNYAQTSTPVDEQNGYAPPGTALLVDVDVTSPGDQAFQSGYFGPRGIIDLEGLVRYTSNQSILTFAPVGYYDALNIVNQAGQPRSLAPSWSFLSARCTIADGAIVPLVGTDVANGGAAFVDSSLLLSVDGGKLNGFTNNHEFRSFVSMVGIGGVVDERRRVGFDAVAVYQGMHPLIPAPSGPHWSGAGNIDPPNVVLEEDVLFRAWDGPSGTSVNPTRFIGLDIYQLTKGVANIGIRNASPYQSVPTAQSFSVAGTTITANAHRKELTNSSGGSITLTSAPTIPDGQPGQEITLVNVGAQNIVLQDQGTLPSSNLRLTAATVTLTPRDSIKLYYSSAVGDWVQDGQVVAVL